MSSAHLPSQGDRASSPWDDLIAASILGTERRPYGMPPLNGRLAEFAAGLDTSNQERLLLALASTLSTYEKSGRLCGPNAEPLPESCGEEQSPIISLRAERYLELVLVGQYSELLEECLYSISHHGKLIPPAYLPGLLDIGKERRAVRKHIIPVVGKRGKWLAAMNPDWGYVGGEAGEDIWDTGSREQRLLYLKDLRATESATGRELLMSTWSAEPHEERAAFLEAFEIGLGMDDEPFLEGVLDDKRKEVRSAAARLLSRLPESRLCRRMIERLAPLLSFNPGKSGIFSLGKGPKLEVTLPETCDKSMVRDGIEEKSQGPVAQKMWWLAQMIASVPPAFWRTTWGVSSSDILEASTRTDWKEELSQAWVAAAERHRDTDLAETMLRERRDKESQSLRASLVAALSPERAEALVLSEQGSPRALELLYCCDFPWSSSMSRMAVDFLHVLVQKSDWSEWQARDTSRFFARQLAPDTYTQADSRLGAVTATDSPWSRPIADLLSYLQFRSEMRHAVQE